MSVKIEGLENVISALRDVAPKEARNLARNTVQQVASDIAKDAADRVRVDQGDLKRAIKAMRRNSRGGDSFESVVHVLRNAFYWRFEEYGQGPDGVEVAMFLKALNKYKADGQQRHLDALAKVLERRIKRAMKRG